MIQGLMNQTIVNILGRRSVRAYKSDLVGKSELDSLLEAGRHAPTALNQQPWHFTVIRDKEMLEKLECSCQEAFRESSVEALREIALQEGFSVFYHAPALIIVSGDRTARAPQYDCSLAMENMMIAATSLGLGSCWTHSIMMFHATEKGKGIFREIGLHFPSNHDPYAAAVFGYPAEPLPEKPPRSTDCVTMIG